MGFIHKLFFHSVKRTGFVIFGLIIAITLPITLFQIQKSQDLRQRAVSENAPTIIPKIAVIFIYFDYPQTTITPYPSGPSSLTPYPTWIPPLTPYPTFVPTLPVDPVTNSVLTVDLVKDILQGKGYGNQVSVNSFYNEMTSGKIQFAFDYFGWYAANQIAPSCQGGFEVMEIGNNIMKDNGVDLSAYDLRLYISSPINGCALGYGQPKNNSLSYGMAVIYDTPVVSVYSHELGHSLGLNHANHLSCLIPNDYTTNCENIEYGDPFDIMGTWASTTYFNAPHQIGIGLLLEDQVESVSQNGTYSVVPIGLKTTEKQALKILRRNSGSLIHDGTTGKSEWFQDYYYVEYRRSVGLDSNLPSKNEGIAIHSWNGSIFTQTYLLNKDSKLLLDGEKFYDQNNDISIIMMSHNENYAEVKIEAGPNAFTPLPTPDRYSIELNPSNEIAITTGQDITLDAQILLDGKPLTDKSGLNYKWFVGEDSVSTVSMMKPESFCEPGMVEPCPLSHVNIKGLQPGIATILVYINKPTEGLSQKGLYTIRVTDLSPTTSPTNVPGSPTNTPIPGTPSAPPVDTTIACPPGAIVPNTTLKGSGDANCNGRIDLGDYNLWRDEFIAQLVGTVGRTKYSDFNIPLNDVGLGDYNIWRDNFILTLTP